MMIMQTAVTFILAAHVFLAMCIFAGKMARYVVSVEYALLRHLRLFRFVPALALLCIICAHALTYETPPYASSSPSAAPSGLST